MASKCDQCANLRETSLVHGLGWVCEKCAHFAQSRRIERLRSRLPKRPSLPRTWFIEFFDDFDEIMRIAARMHQLPLPEVEYGWAKTILQVEARDRREAAEVEVVSREELDEMFRDV